MYKAMPTMPVSDLRLRQAAVIAKLEETPILLTQRGHSAGVLVHPELWNDLIERLQEYDDLLVAAARQQEARHDETVMRPIADLRAHL